MVVKHTHEWASEKYLFISWLESLKTCRNKQINSYSSSTTNYNNIHKNELLVISLISEGVELFLIYLLIFSFIIKLASYLNKSKLKTKNINI